MIRDLVMAGICGMLAIGPAVPAAGQVPSYADLFNPLQVRNLNLQMDPADWITIRNDSTYDIEKPAYFWTEGEQKIIVSVRNKAPGADGDKIPLKIDVNEYFDGQQWHGLKKLSLENGYEKNPVYEGFAWYLHRLAGESDTRTYGYRPSLASWVNVTVNGNMLGVYTAVEQPDKTLLRNRDLWVADKTWLYKQGDIGAPTLEAGSGSSPQVAALNFAPFDARPARPAPSGAQLQSELRANIDMHSMLTLAAVEQYTANGDALFSKGKNVFFADFDGVSGGLRSYLPWDQDSVFNGVTKSVYGAGPYANLILNDPVFRAEYEQIMRDLLNGPLSVTNLNGFLDQLQAALSPSLEADPYSRIDDVAGHFDDLRSWVTHRNANVLNQLPRVGAAPAGELMSESSAMPVPEPSAVAMLFSGAIALAWLRRTWQR
jgi:spore coat protein CotH